MTAKDGTYFNARSRLQAVLVNNQNNNSNNQDNVYSDVIVAEPLREFI